MGKQRKKLKRSVYEEKLAELHFELVKMQYWIKETGQKLVLIVEGRDAAGKGGAVKTITEPLNPRGCRIVALGTPSDKEKTQWYFQRYVSHLPAAGEIVLFDRSWYNRAGVEHVMGFCSKDEYAEFLQDCPEFEKMLVRSGITLLKVLVFSQRRRAGTPVQGTGREPCATLEAESDGPQIHPQMGRGLQSERRDVPLHRHQESALVDRGSGRQTAGTTQLHRPYPELGSLQGCDAPAARSSQAPAT